jgi:hypothetical protein
LGSRRQQQQQQQRKLSSVKNEAKNCKVLQRVESNNWMIEVLIFAFHCCCLLRGEELSHANQSHEKLPLPYSFGNKGSYETF